MIEYDAKDFLKISLLFRSSDFSFIVHGTSALHDLQSDNGSSNVMLFLWVDFKFIIDIFINEVRKRTLKYKVDRC